jgi:hypothetical protein
MNSSSQIMFDNGEYSAAQQYYVHDDVATPDDCNKTQQQQQHSNNYDRTIASTEKPPPPSDGAAASYYHHDITINSSREEYDSSATAANSLTKSTSNNEYERLADKLFVGRAASSSSSCSGGDISSGGGGARGRRSESNCGRSSSIEIPSGHSKVANCLMNNYCNNNEDGADEDGAGASKDDDYDMMDIIESQSSLSLTTECNSEVLHSSEGELHLFEREGCLPQQQQQQQQQQQSQRQQQVMEEKTTPKAGNLKTTGLDDCWKTAPIDYQVPTRHHHHSDNRNLSNVAASSSEIAAVAVPSSEIATATTAAAAAATAGQDYYLPQSAAILLNTLQNISNLNKNGSNNNGTTNNGSSSGSSTRGMEELLAMLRSSVLSSSGVLDVGGEMFDHGEDDGGDRDDKNGCAPKPAVSNSNFYNDDDDDDDDYSLNGDMARLSKSIASLQRDLDNIDLSQFDDMYGDDDVGREGISSSSSGNMEQDLLLDALNEDISDDRRRGVTISKKWKRWIRNWLLSRGLINDDKVINSLLGSDDDDHDRGVYALPTTMVDGEGGEGFRLFDFEVDHVLILTLLLVFFVFLYHRFKNAAEYF